jgi:hypothetical protein
MKGAWNCSLVSTHRLLRLKFARPEGVDVNRSLRVAAMITPVFDEYEKHQAVSFR